MGLTFGVLGPLEVHRDGVPLAVGGPRQRSVLAVLLLQPRRVVSVPALLDAVWDGRPGDKADATLHVHVSGLRRALGPDGGLVVTRPPGYLVDAAVGDVDLDRFRAARQEGVAAVRAGDHTGAARSFRSALELWRGRPLADLAGLRVAEQAAVTLEEERLVVLEHRLAADLHAGRSAELVGELRALLAEHPLREGLWHHLVTALYRASRQGDALAALARVRALLRDELGIEPGPDLQDLHRRVLAQDPTLVAPRATGGDLGRTRPAHAEDGSGGSLVGGGAVHRLHPGRTRIGRDPAGEVVLDDDQVSRRHAEVIAAAGELLLIDQGSTNGTWVNGSRVSRHVLAHGDELRFGGAVLVFQQTGTQDHAP